jgi:hypothetical protein
MKTTAPPSAFITTPLPEDLLGSFDDWRFVYVMRILLNKMRETQRDPALMEEYRQWKADREQGEVA